MSLRPWSYSRLSTYESCPKQFFYSYVEKIPSARPPSVAAERGSNIHKQAELYLKDELKLYPKELQKVAGHAMKLKTVKASAELKLAVTEEWKPCEWGAPETYFRGVIDITYLDGTTLHVEDWKTGQEYDSHADQMIKYVALTAPHFPEATEFITRLVYIDQGFVSPPRRVSAERLKPIRLMIDGSIQNAEADEIYPVNPGPKTCKWCDYNVKFGGPCGAGARY